MTGTRAILAGAGALSAAAIAGSLAAGWQLTRPVPAEIGPAPRDLPAQTVSFQSASGATVRGWFARSDRSRGAVLLLPPVRANRLAMLPRAKFLREAGYSTLLVDLQATGESSGAAITFGWLERLDVLAAVRFLAHRAPDQPVAVLGVSLGGAAALLATPPLRVQALVLEAVYPSIDAAVDNRLRMRIGPAGSLLSPLLLLQMRPRLGVDPSHLRPIDHIASVGCPVLIIGGAGDRHTTADDTRRLYDAASQPKQLWIVPGAAHVDYYAAAGDEYRGRVLTFLAQMTPPGRLGPEPAPAPGVLPGRGPQP